MSEHDSDQRLVVSAAARPHLAAMLAAQPSAGSAIRLAVMGGGAEGSGIGLMLDDPDETDERFAFDTIELVVDSSLLSYCKQIRIDFQDGSSKACQGTPRGFIITAETPINI
ncbi:MAG: hypothetical protein JKP90_18665 [Desulfofustis sp. PB-SRB1]|jgi:Fe-S cluster assembly iron-binding protein IscA|nr:hypothetical protein [Desulfofustis sp. PB-SRB1]